MNIGPCSKGGVLPTIAGVLWQSPSGIISKVTSIIVVNTGAAIATVNIFWRSGLGTGGTLVRIFPKDSQIAVGGSLQEEVTLLFYPLDTIEGNRGVGATCDWSIFAAVLG